IASLTFMSYADMLFAIVPAAPPTRKNQRTTSCPAPISANVPYQRGSRLIFSAFECVSIVSSFTGQQTRPVFRALNVQIVHQPPQSKAWCDSDEETGQKFVLQTVNGDCHGKLLF